MPEPDCGGVPESDGELLALPVPDGLPVTLWVADGVTLPVPVRVKDAAAVPVRDPVIDGGGVRLEDTEPVAEGDGVTLLLDVVVALPLLVSDGEGVRDADGEVEPVPVAEADGDDVTLGSTLGVTLDVPVGLLLRVALAVDVPERVRVAVALRLPVDDAVGSFEFVRDAVREILGSAEFVREAVLVRVKIAVRVGVGLCPATSATHNMATSAARHEPMIDRQASDSNTTRHP